MPSGDRTVLYIIHTLSDFIVCIIMSLIRVTFNGSEKKSFS